jgi:hypothetical protein
VGSDSVKSERQQSGRANHSERIPGLRFQRNERNCLYIRRKFPVRWFLLSSYATLLVYRADQATDGRLVLHDSR